MNKIVTATEAKNKFGELLDSVASGPVFIQKNGRNAAVLLSKADYEASNANAAKKALVQQFHEESMEKHADVYEALAK